VVHNTQGMTSENVIQVGRLLCFIQIWGFSLWGFSLKPGFCLQDLILEVRFVERSANRYGLQLAGHIPDQGSGMKWYVGIVAYLVKYRYSRSSFYCFIHAFVQEDGLDVLCRTPDVPRDSVVAHDAL
jgi:hypothetical protein